MEKTNLEQLTEKILALKEEARELREMGSQMKLPAVERNARRILASLRLLEITVVELQQSISRA